MRLLSLLTTALLPVAILAAKKSPEERFNAALAKGQPQKLTDISFDSITKAPRDYSVAVLLTALDSRFACQLCNDFQPEWELLAKSWSKGDKNKESRLLFGTLDFGDGKATFQSVRHGHGDKMMETLVDEVLTRPILSSNCKPLPSSYSSTQPQAPMPNSTSHSTASTSTLQGAYTQKHTASSS